MAFFCKHLLTPLIPLLVCCSYTAGAQRVGVVLSGGGATAMAHIGFLRALEENNIPIDYIGGTSMGAVIAAMYSAGYSVDEIDSIVSSDDYIRMSKGLIDEKLKFYFKNDPPDVSMATIKYSRGEFIGSTLPSNLINPVLVDWTLMEGLSQADAAAHYDFDSLFVPFRCIAADIAGKQEVIFRGGSLSVATRASSTYPFYLPPRRVDGKLLFDGGLYNNFPSNVVYLEFMPDVILGCNVTENSAPPMEDDLFSQLVNMITNQSNFDRLCEQMIVIEPAVQEIGTFDFDKTHQAIAAGYKATADSMASIQTMVTRRISTAERQTRRSQFHAKFKPLIIDDISINGLEKGQNNYVRRMMGKQPVAELKDLKAPYFRLFADDKIESVFPILHLNDTTGYYNLDLHVKREKDIFLSFGGNFSSRSINTGYFGLRYNIFGSTSATISANAYFGRFYGSVSANVRWDLSSTHPFSIQASFTQNRWDFYKSLATFFEDVKPSFIVMNERFGGLTFRFPAGNVGMIKADAIYVGQVDDYYQSNQFLSTDTADATEFTAGVARLTWERSTLNRKMYPSDGTFLSFSVKGVTGREVNIPGSTSFYRDTIEQHHQWLTARFQYTNYFERVGNLTMGFRLEAVASSQPFFNNYISSVIAAPSYQPTPESATYFLPALRAHSFAGGGGMLVYHLGRNMELRAEMHALVPYRRIVSSSREEAVYTINYTPIFTSYAGLVFHTPIGPLSFTVNYYDQKEDPWSYLFHFGYILFNPSSRD